MKKNAFAVFTFIVSLICTASNVMAQGNAVSAGKQLFETETFGGNGRTCRTCHSVTTGTVSPQDAQQLFNTHPNDPLFVADGSDDGKGHGTARIRSNATILMRIQLAHNVSVANSPTPNVMTVFRG